MSFFLATVPAGTQLYHGTSKNESVKGPEWLALEPEHALIFAHHDESHPEHHRERPHHGPGPEPDCDGPRPPHKRSDRQQPLLNGPPSDPVKTGYLHTYVPKHDLKLLYLDGMSAGKTSNGTLDTQDILLLNLTSDGGVMGGEHARAQGLCSFSATIWEHKIDGVLRMEGGFEIILCEFEKHLETKEIMPVGGRFVPMNEWQYQKAITQRYHGIGGGRVVLDYSNFVTALEYEELDLWDNDVISDMSMPRLTKAAPKDLLKIKDAVTEMILQSSKTESSSDEKKKKVDWQAVADALVARYSAPLHYLHTDASIRSDRNAYVSYLSTLLRPFIDNTSRNHTLETSRCISQFVPTLPLPPANPPALAHQALYSVSQHLCSTLLAASDIATRALSRSLSTAPPAGRAVALVDGLRDYLQWTSWKECKACGDEEICVVPIWPMGSHEQHREPKCQGEDEARFEGGYWGRRGMGGPPGHGGPPGEGRPPREGKFGPVHGGGKKGKGRKHGGKCMKNKNQENQGVTSVRSKVSEARLALSGWFRAGGYWRASE
ncbi:hypothetical protein K504DRAFT_442252 [Pleomassaria siparia CBS 279.74]|uniref:Uncharacterized protein n=1 Tax=Pleomassaria siparia CBS 279.74 TaxID=1314801 RepID=A0A6G1JUC0_9PLEO|nr:hypothetical protein K504DRAFT_442252 [Pleomassaria siparia CBS 279.74]